MSVKRCGSCRHLDKASATDIGGLPIAICRHPTGVRIGTTRIHHQFVAIDSGCASHQSRFKPIPATTEQTNGGIHA